jgi:hypothetical protein
MKQNKILFNNIFNKNLLKNATNGMKVAQSPIKPSADRQQRQVIAPPKPPNNPPSAPAPPALPAPSRPPGGGYVALQTNSPSLTVQKI